MISNVSKDRATINGQRVKMVRVTTKTYRGGKYYIRFFANSIGECIYNLVKVNGRPHKCKYRDKRYIPPLKVNTEFVTFRRSICGDDYVTDLGMGGGAAVLYEFNARSLAVCQYLNDNRDYGNALMLTQDIAKEDVAGAISDAKLERLLDDQNMDDFWSERDYDDSRE